MMNISEGRALMCSDHSLAEFYRIITSTHMLHLFDIVSRIAIGMRTCSKYGLHVVTEYFLLVITLIYIPYDTYFILNVKS